MKKIIGSTAAPRGRFWRLLRNAYASQDISERARKKIKRALMHVNFQDSNQDIREALASWPQIAKISPTGEAVMDELSGFDYRKLATQPGVAGCQLYSWQNWPQFKDIQKLEEDRRSKPAGDPSKGNPIDPLSATKVWFAQAEADSMFGVSPVLVPVNVRKELWAALKNYRESQERLFQDWLWVTPASRNPVSIVEQLLSLGLVHWKPVLPDTTNVLIYQFDCPGDGLQKPHWLHAQLRYIFDPAASVTEHGYTRCLASGGVGCKEWVSKPGKLPEPSSILVVRPERKEDLGRPSPEFFRGSLNRILEHRKK